MNAAPQARQASKPSTYHKASNPSERSHVEPAARLWMFLGGWSRDFHPRRFTLPPFHRQTDRQTDTHTHKSTTMHSRPMCTHACTHRSTHSSRHPPDTSCNCCGCSVDTCQLEHTRTSVSACMALLRLSTVAHLHTCMREGTQCVF